MSDVLLFTIGCVVFAATTAATLLYGYFSFYAKGVEDGLGPKPPLDPATADVSNSNQ